jgi:lipopolysaccharide export system permease protein
VGAENNQLQKVFLATQDNDEQNIHIVYANTGKVMVSPDGSQELILQQAKQSEGTTGEYDYQVITFDQYQLQIAEQETEQKRRKLEAYSNSDLLEEGSAQAMAELQWRIAVPLSLPFLVLIAVPLSAVDPRQGRFGKIAPALMLYLGYFLLLMAARKVMEEGKIPPSIGLWWVHGLIFVIGTTLIMKGRQTGTMLRLAFSGRGHD